MLRRRAAAEACGGRRCWAAALGRGEWGTLYPHCTPSVPPLYPHCTPLYTHCTPTVPSLYPHCTLTVPPTVSRLMRGGGEKGGGKRRRRIEEGEELGVGGKFVRIHLST